MEKADKKREKELKQFEEIYGFKKSGSKLSDNIKETLKRVKNTNKITNLTISKVEIDVLEQDTSLPNQNFKEDKLVSDEIFSMTNTRFMLNQKNKNPSSRDVKLNLFDLYTPEKNCKSWVPDYLISTDRIPSNEALSILSDDDSFIDDIIEFEEMC